LVVKSYPVALGISYLLLGGYVCRSLFVSMGLPASVGVMLAGFLFSYFSQDAIMEARDDIQELSFFLVLLMAGLEIRLKELKPYIFVMAWVPACLEVIGISTFAHFCMGLPPQEGLVLAVVVCALGDGLVIPKMKEFMMAMPEHPLPRLVFMWAPLEASFILTAFGIVTGLASPREMEPTTMGVIVLANILRIVATVLCGALLGGISGWALPKRTKVKIFGKSVFNGTAIEAFLIVLSVTLFAFALGKGRTGHELVPMGFCSGSWFQPELLVIVTGSCFGYFTDRDLLHQVEHLLGELWVFGGILLFSMLGSKTSTDILPQVVRVLPIMFVGFACRFIGVFAGTALTAKARGLPNLSTVLPDALFCSLCTIPRATIQGALGAVPLSLQFFSEEGYTNKDEVRDFIFTAARLYIVCCSVGGMTLLTTFGPPLLERTRKDHMAAMSSTDGSCSALESGAETGPENEDGSMLTDLANSCDDEGYTNDLGGDIELSGSARFEEAMLEAVAAKYGMTLDALLVLLQQHKTPDKRLSNTSSDAAKPFCAHGPDVGSSSEGEGYYSGVSPTKKARSFFEGLLKHKTVLEEPTQPRRRPRSRVPRFPERAISGGLRLFDSPAAPQSERSDRRTGRQKLMSNLPSFRRASP